MNSASHPVRADDARIAPTAHKASAEARAAHWSPSEAAREVRLGLVVYGGVSLAIYINGVTHEFFRAVRGRGVYKLFKRLLDSHIVVDIISGTSAGGINGLLLAFALTNDREFGDSAQLWREHGSLGSLLRHVEDSVGAVSLLDSRDVYLPKLEEAFRNMSGTNGAESEWCSRFPELDLFVTGTDFDGRITTTTDTTGRQIDIKTHRRVFHLKHRENLADGESAFRISRAAGTEEEQARLKALARLAALTSSFPAAFEPVRVGPVPDDAIADRAYKMLKHWGGLEGETWFLDGGVLDNKPFSFTIDQIFQRTASCPVDRKLFYVEPDPERFDAGRRRTRESPPNLVQSAVDALVGIPGYESIAEDLERIADRNRRLQRQRRVAEAAREALQDLTDAPGSLPKGVEAIYLRVRQATLCDRAVALLLEGSLDCEIGAPGEKGDIRRQRSTPRREQAKACVQKVESWELQDTEALDRYDVDYRIRRLFHVIYRVAWHVQELSKSPLSEAGHLENLTGLRETWEHLNRQLTAYRIVKHTTEAQIRQQRGAGSGWESMKPWQIWGLLQARMEELLRITPEPSPAAACVMCEGEGGLSPEAAADFRTALQRQAAAIGASRAESTETGPDAPSVYVREGRTILDEIDDRTRRLLLASPAAYRGNLLQAWDHFRVYDAHFFPLEYFGGLGEKDEIEIVRVSPADADLGFCARRFEDKVTGESVMHFGAFFKRSWRSNDIMWGRLDGVCRLFDALFTDEALKRALNNATVREALAKDLTGDALAPKTLFPNAGEQVQTCLSGWLRNLASDDETVRRTAIDDKAKRELVLWCAQLEILHAELPHVFDDAAIEQLEWNNMLDESAAAAPAVLAAPASPAGSPARASEAASGRGSAPARTVFRPLCLRIDLAMAVRSGRTLAKQFVAEVMGDGSPFSHPREAPLARYFETSYRVGKETIRDNIPPTVLLELVTSILLVSRNCLIAAAPVMASRVTSQPLYKLLVHYPLVVAHTLAVFARRDRVLSLCILTGMTVYAVGGLLVAAFVPATIWGADGLNKTHALFLVAGPLLFLTIGVPWCWLKAISYWKRSRWLSVAKIGLTVAATAIVVTLAAGLFAVAESLVNQFAAWVPFVGGQTARVIAGIALIAMLIVLFFVIPAASRAINRRFARATV